MRFAPNGTCGVADSLLDKFHKAAIDSVKTDTPQSFTVGAHADILAKKGEATVSYNRTIWNGFGATAYLKGWWNDTAVVPSEKRGLVVGAEGTYKF